MKCLLAGLLLTGIVGCGGSSLPQSISMSPTSPPLPPGVAESATTLVISPPTNVAELPAQATEADPCFLGTPLDFYRNSSDARPC